VEDKDRIGRYAVHGARRTGVKSKERDGARRKPHGSRHNAHGDKENFLVPCTVYLGPFFL
jgi:hypothetical protein